MPSSRTSKEDIERMLEDADDARTKWGLHLYGVDTQDPSQYDLVVRTKKFSIDDAVDVICLAARMDGFQTTAESQQALDDLMLSARVKAHLVERFSRVQVTANRGAVHIGLEGANAREEEEIRKAAAHTEGVKKVDFHSHPFVTPD